MTELMETYIENREMVQPHHANPHGTAHGGNVMKWMDEVGAMSAMRFAGESVVTARMEQVNFKRPIPVGDTAFIESYVYDTGRTSMKVRIKVFAESLQDRETELTTESFFVYVAVDENGDPTPVPDLEVASEEADALRQSALDGENDLGDGT